MNKNDADNSLEWASQAYALLKQKQKEEQQILEKQTEEQQVLEKETPEKRDTNKRKGDFKEIYKD